MVTECTNQLCDSQLAHDYCFAMSYSVSMSGTTMKGWQKGCTIKEFCDSTDEQICTHYNDILNGTMTFSECRVACSQSNDVVVPEPTGKRVVVVVYISRDFNQYIFTK